MQKLTFLVLAVALAGCSNKAIYNQMRIHERNACQEQPPSLYFECLERANKSYGQYEIERNSL